MINGFLVNLGIFFTLVVVVFLLQHNPKGFILFYSKNISSAFNWVLKNHQFFFILCEFEIIPFTLFWNFAKR